MKYIFVFNLVLNLKHKKNRCVFACVYGEGGALGIHLEAKGAPDWKSLGTTALEDDIFFH